MSVRVIMANTSITNKDHPAANPDRYIEASVVSYSYGRIRVKLLTRRTDAKLMSVETISGHDFVLAAYCADSDKSCCYFVSTNLAS